MTGTFSPCARFRTAIKEEKPLQVMGAINAYSARLAERVGLPFIFPAEGLPPVLSRRDYEDR